MAQPLCVDYDAEQNRFFITCPMWCNDMMSEFPLKRWSKAKRAWAVPPVRQNIKVLTGNLAAYCTVSSKAVNRIKQAIKESEKSVDRHMFPAWYKFKTDPDPHQLEGLNHLYGLKAISLHMDPGTGKSKLVIDFACALRMENKIECVLLMCKLSLRHNWVKELDRHSTVPFSLHMPDTNKPGAFNTWLTSRHDFKILIVGFESLSQGSMHKLVEKFLLSSHKVLAIGDETHMISNHQAVRSQRVVSFGRMAEYRAGLTGTPISTGPLNLFMQYEFLDPDIIGIGDFYAFRNRYAVMGGYQDARGRPLQVVGYQNIDELTKLVAPHTYSTSKAVLKLPPKTYEVRTVKMTGDQATLYAQIKKDRSYVLEGKDRVFNNVLELALRLHQVAQGHLTKYTQEEKIDVQTGELLIKAKGEGTLLMPWNKNPKILELADVMRDVEVPTVVWCNYKPDIILFENMIKSEFPNRRYATITGGREKENFDNIRKFQDGKLDCLVSNVGVGGTGHDMYAAELMIYMNNNERLIDRIQSEDRAHRRGLTHPVLYIDILAEKTVDVAIMKSIELKMNLSDYIKGRIGELVAVLVGE